MTLLEIRPGLTLDDETIEFRFVRASGPGGQNVNKVSTAVELRFDTRRWAEMPDAMAPRLATLAGQRMTQDGIVVIFAQSYRSQIRNREDATERLVALLREAAEVPRRRRPTRPTQGSKTRRLDTKARRGNVKRMRGSPDSSS